MKWLSKEGISFVGRMDQFDIHVKGIAVFEGIRNKAENIGWEEVVRISLGSLVVSKGRCLAG